jgi:hypothetical protein
MAAKDRWSAQLGAEMAFGQEGVNRLNAGNCPCCGPENKTFRDALSRKEYEISGLCQVCQDKTFGTGEEI